MLRGTILSAAIIFSALCSATAYAGLKTDLAFNLYFKAFCKNDLKEVQVIEKNEPVLIAKVTDRINFHLRLNNDGSTRKVQPQVYHLMNSAGYDVYVSLEIIRERGQKNFHIRLTPWRRLPEGRDISYGTAFLEQEAPTPIANLGVAVNEEINEATGSYCTLTATIATK